MTDYSVGRMQNARSSGFDLQSFKVGMLAHPCNPSKQEGQKFSHPWLQREFKNILAYIRPCLTKQKHSRNQKTYIHYILVAKGKQLKSQTQQNCPLK